MTGAGRIRALIVDDEAPARQVIAGLLAADPDIEVVGEPADGRSALAAIEALRPDLVFLDVQMPGLGGFEVIERLGADRAPVVVFVTAYSQHALRAFDVSAVDYLLKPFDDERFARALERAKRRVREGRAKEVAAELTALLQNVGPESAAGAGLRAAPMAGPPRAGGFLERLPVPTGRGTALLDVGDIDWLEAEDYYVEVHSRGRGYLLRQPLKDLEASLDPKLFVRIHRSAVVNRARVREIVPATHGDYTIVLADGTRLRLSRTHHARLRDLVGR